MSQIPVIGKRGQIVHRRRESNTELMHDSILKRGKIGLRVVIQIRDARGIYRIWRGAATCCEVKSIAEAREFMAKLKQTAEGEKK